MPCRIYKLDFQELGPGFDYISNTYMLSVRAFGVYRFKRNICAWAGMVKSAWLEIWRSAVQIFLFKI